MHCHTLCRLSFPLLECLFVIALVLVLAASLRGAR